MNPADELYDFRPDDQVCTKCGTNRVWKRTKKEGPNLNKYFRACSGGRCDSDDKVSFWYHDYHNQNQQQPRFKRASEATNNSPPKALKMDGKNPSGQRWNGTNIQDDVASLKLALQELQQEVARLSVVVETLRR